MKKFVKKVVNSLSKDFRWDKNGGEIYEEHWMEKDCVVISICPIPVEIVGGAKDGLGVWKPFILNLKSIPEIFDDIDSLDLHSPHKHEPAFLSISGLIDGNKVRLKIQTKPSPDLDIQAYLDNDKDNFILRRKPPVIENRVINEETGLYEE